MPRGGSAPGGDFVFLNLSFFPAHPATDNPADAELPGHFTGILVSPHGVTPPSAATVAFVLGGGGGAPVSPPDPLDASVASVDLLARARASRPALASPRIPTHVILIGGPSTAAPPTGADADEDAVTVAARLDDFNGDLLVVVVPPPPTDAADAADVKHEHQPPPPPRPRPVGRGEGGAGGGRARGRDARADARRH